MEHYLYITACSFLAPSGPLFKETSAESQSNVLKITTASSFLSALNINSSPTGRKQALARQDIQRNSLNFKTTQTVKHWDLF